MAKDYPPIVNRRIRRETVHINGVPVKFYRCAPMWNASKMKKPLTFQAAKKLRGEIRAKHIHAVLNRIGDGYVVRICSSRGLESGAREVDFYSASEWRKWKKRADSEDAKRAAMPAMPPPRSPIEVMIDRACGLIP